MRWWLDGNGFGGFVDLVQVTWTASQLSSSLVSLRDAPVPFGGYERYKLTAASPRQVCHPGHASVSKQ